MIKIGVMTASQKNSVKTVCEGTEGQKVWGKGDEKEKGRKQLS